MASLRDVLNHIGQKAELVRDGHTVFAGLAIRRGNDAFLEPKEEPSPGDLLTFVETGERFKVEAVEPERVRDRLDHYRLKVAPA